MLEIGLAIIGSFTALGVAYIGVMSKRTRDAVNGSTTILLARIEHLETLLSIARTRLRVFDEQAKRDSV